VHSDERPYKCKFGCGFGAKTAGNCKKHEESKHTRKRLYVDGKPLPLRKMSNIKDKGCKPRSENTTVYKTRFRDVRDEILDEVIMKSEEEVVDIMVEVCPLGKTDPRVGISPCPQTREKDPEGNCEIMPNIMSNVRATVIEPALDMEVDDIDDYEPVSQM
jgi:hypothetical protein